jgi:transcriptional regulator with XRE-family HTH domain
MNFELSEIQRVRKVINWLIFSDYGSNEKEIAEKLGYTKSSFSQIINGKVPLSLKFIEKLFAVDKKLNKSWIVTGDGFMLNSIHGLMSEDKVCGVQNIANVPLVSARGQGGYLKWYDNAEYIDSLDSIPLIVDRSFKGKFRCFEVEGDSMDDGSRKSICDRDIVLGRELKRELWSNKHSFTDWDIIIVYNDNITIKRIREMDNNTGILKCYSLNSFYEGTEFQIDSLIELYCLIKIVERSTRR